MVLHRNPVNGYKKCPSLHEFFFLLLPCHIYHDISARIAHVFRRGTSFNNPLVEKSLLEVLRVESGQSCDDMNAQSWIVKLEGKCAGCNYATPPDSD